MELIRIECSLQPLRGRGLEGWSLVPPGLGWREEALRPGETLNSFLMRPLKVLHVLLCRACRRQALCWCPCKIAIIIPIFKRANQSSERSRDLSKVNP